MIYFAPVCSTVLPMVRRFGRSLLVLPLCVLLIGCDSASSNDDQGVTTQFAPASNAGDSDGQNTSKSAQDNSQQQSDSDNLDKEAGGQSLIAAAQSDNDMKPAMLSSGPEGSSTLQATLMGDYGGMVPCDFCDCTNVTLNLFADGSVSKTSIYHNPKKPQAPLRESGVYRQDNNTITIVYTDKNIETYHIQDNHLILIDEEKNLNNDYVLSRQ